MEAEQKPKRKKLNEWGVYEDGFFVQRFFALKEKKYKKNGIDTLLETDIAGWKSTFSNRRYTYKWSKCSLLCWLIPEKTRLDQRFGSLKIEELGWNLRTEKSTKSL